MLANFVCWCWVLAKSVCVLVLGDCQLSVCVLVLGDCQVCVCWCWVLAKSVCVCVCVGVVCLPTVCVLS